VSESAGVHVEWTYAPLVLLGVLALLLTRPTRDYDPIQRKAWLRIQVITLVAAVIGAKFAALVGDSGWPLESFPGWQAVMSSGRSIVGALLFGFIAAELAKPWLHYLLPPNDRFAVALPLSIAIGRIGCWLSGCCLGVPVTGVVASIGPDGITRFPTAIVEFAFHVTAGLILWHLLKRGLYRGRLFSIYLIAYGLFRFATEFVRVTPKAFAGYSAYHWLSLGLVVAGLYSAWRYRSLGNNTTTPLAGGHP